MDEAISYNTDLSGFIFGRGHQSLGRAWILFPGVRNLHEAAKYILKEHGGLIPSTKEELQKVKGLGPYTIGAILSFAFHKRAVAVDGNVVRVISRYFMIDDDILKSATQKKISLLTESLLPVDQPWTAMEALIELGAVVCGRKPKCSLCPLQKGCSAYRNGQSHLLPYKSKKNSYVSLERSSHHPLR